MTLGSFLLSGLVLRRTTMRLPSTLCRFKRSFTVSTAPPCVTVPSAAQEVHQD
jgi:hypothetical protein